MVRMDYSEQTVHGFTQVSVEMDDYLPLPDGVRLEGCWLVREGQVNLDDLLRARPGGVIRLFDSDALRYIPPSLDDYARIAGMISDSA